MGVGVTGAPQGDGTLAVNDSGHTVPAEIPENGPPLPLGQCGASEVVGASVRGRTAPLVAPEALLAPIEAPGRGIVWNRMDLGAPPHLVEQPK